MFLIFKDDKNIIKYLRKKRKDDFKVKVQGLV